LKELQDRFQLLKEDFLYNEGVLQERDEEIHDLESRLHRVTADNTSIRQQLHEIENARSALESQYLMERDRYDSYVQDGHNARDPSGSKSVQPVLACYFSKKALTKRAHARKGASCTTG
jgi:septal ring factor EnvC (AmiA/AmiB activator)